VPVGRLLISEGLRVRFPNASVRYLRGVLDRQRQLPDRGATVSRHLPLLILFLALIGCSASSQLSASVRPLGSGERWLQVADWTGTACGGAGLVGDYRLRGSPNDPRLAWMTDPDGTRRELAWSPGTSARFTPGLEVVGPDSAVAAREGWLVVGLCAVGSTGYDFGEFAAPPQDPSAGPSAFP
jgi:hypothetical protein